MRGGLTEMTMALPHGEAEALSEAVAVEKPELESDTKLHVQAVLAWIENYGNGAVYSGLQNYLSERQQEEAYDIVRMSLTAWQLQFNPKNIAFIFDVLWNAGGRLAKLLEIARLKKTEWEAAARFEEISPAECAQGKKTDRNIEIEPQQSELPISGDASTCADDSVTGSVAETSSAEVSLSSAAGAVSEPATNLAPDPIEIDILKVSEGSTLAHVGSFVPANLANFALEPIQDSSSEHFETASPERIAHSRPQARPFGEIFPEKKPYHIPLFGFRGFRMPSATSKTESSPPNVEDLPSQLFVPEKSSRKKVGLRITAIVFLMVGFTVGFTVGLNTPVIPPEMEESRPEKPSATARTASSISPSATFVKSIGPVSSVMSPSLDSDNSFGSQKRDDPTAGEERFKEAARDSETPTKLTSKDSISSPGIESEGTANREVSAKRDDSSKLVARNAPPPALPEFVHSGSVGDSMSRTTKSRKGGSARGTTRGGHKVSVAREVAAAPRATSHASSSSAILVTAPAEGSRALKLTFPEKPIAVSSSFAITSQLSVQIAPEPGPAVAHHPARLQAGKLVAYVWPRYPKPGSRNVSIETVKVLAMIGRLGQVTDVKRVNGSSSLFAAATSAIRQWHFQPTLLNERPVQALQYITIEFRPTSYSSLVSIPHALPN
jgi:hypothetical protein